MFWRTGIARCMMSVFTVAGGLSVAFAPDAGGGGGGSVGDGGLANCCKNAANMFEVDGWWWWSRRRWRSCGRATPVCAATSVSVAVGLRLEDVDSCRRPHRPYE